MKWQLVVWCVFMWCAPIENFRNQELGMLSGKLFPTENQPRVMSQGLVNSVPELFAKAGTEIPGNVPGTSVEVADNIQFLEDVTTSVPLTEESEPPDRHHTVRHAGLPHKMEVFPLPLENSDHELKFNVSWLPSMRSPARDYSLEVRSVTETSDCESPMCYEYNIPGRATWWLVPQVSNPVAETCAVRPGCAYMVRLIAHPWDGHTSANMHVELDECVVGVCSCAHSPRLPVPIVRAETVTKEDDVYTNVSWTLPRPSYPQRLPSSKLGKLSYVVSLGKQMVSDAHPAPWFANIITRRVNADGYVSEGDNTQWVLLRVSEKGPGDERGGERKEKARNVPVVKLLARVSLIDERGCIGPAGNATAYDPDEASSKISFGTYAILLALGGAWLMGAVFVLSARVVKHVLKSFRPAPVSAPLEPLRRRPAWFPLQLRT